MLSLDWAWESYKVSPWLWVSSALIIVFTTMAFRYWKFVRLLFLVGHPSIVVKALVALGKEFISRISAEERLLKYIFEHSQEGDPESILRTADTFSQVHRFMMHIGNEKGKILRETIQKLKPKVVVELGGYCGYSAILMGSLLSDDARFYSIELNPLFAAISTKIIERAGLSHKVKVLVGASNSILPLLREKYNIEAIDVLFIDHLKSVYVRDIKLVEELKLLRSGSVVMADNILIPGAPDYLAYMQSSPKYESKLIEANVFSSVKDAVLVSNVN